jgi:hypothetical protein
MSRSVEALARLLLDELDRVRFGGPYFLLPPAFRAAVVEITATEGPAQASRRMRELLLHLVDRSGELESAPWRLKLPDSFRGPLAVEHERIRAECAQAGDEPVSLADDLYVKDLAVATFKLLPAGAQLVDVNYGIPRSTISRSFRHSVGAGLGATWYLLARCGGFTPAVEIHTSQKTLGEFTEEGWRKCYLRIADLMALNPSIRAMYGMSWFYDPQLDTVSPRLAYLRREPVAHGARLFHWGPDEKSVQNAIATSPSRRRLYEAGEYVPVGYMLVWSRDDMLRYRRTIGDGHTRP